MLRCLAYGGGGLNRGGYPDSFSKIGVRTVRTDKAQKKTTTKKFLQEKILVRKKWLYAEARPYQGTTLRIRPEEKRVSAEEGYSAVVESAVM